MLCINPQNVFVLYLWNQCFVHNIDYQSSDWSDFSSKDWLTLCEFWLIAAWTNRLILTVTTCYIIGNWFLKMTKRRLDDGSNRVMDIFLDYNECSEGWWGITVQLLTWNKIFNSSDFLILIMDLKNWAGLGIYNASRSWMWLHRMVVGMKLK